MKGRAQKKKKSCGFRGLEAHGAQRNTMLLLVQLIVDFLALGKVHVYTDNTIGPRVVRQVTSKFSLSKYVRIPPEAPRFAGSVTIFAAPGNGRGEGLSPAIASPISLAVVMARPGRATRSPPAPLRPDPPRSPPSRARRAPPGAVFRPVFSTSAARGLGVSRAEWAKRSLRAAPAASSRSVGRVESPEARRSRSGAVEGVEARRRTARDQGWYPSA